MMRAENPNRNFTVLEQLHVLPNVTYLAKVRNDNAKAESHAAKGHEAAGHEAKAEGHEAKGHAETKKVEAAH
jgi:molybdopterin-containing oxidoreductase family iron-sulfur binding subunit